MRTLAMVVGSVVVLASASLAAQATEVKYNCQAKTKKGVADAASVIVAKSESAALESMRKRWPGFATYTCVPTK